MADLLSQLAFGLRQAGGVLSPSVYNQNINQQMAEDAFRRRLQMQQFEQAQKDQREQAIARAVGPHLESGDFSAAARAAAATPGGFSVGMNLLGAAEAREARLAEAKSRIEARQQELIQNHKFRMEQLAQQGADRMALAETDRQFRLQLAREQMAGRQALAQVAASLKNTAPDFQKVVGNEGKLRDDFNQLSKSFIGVRDAHQRVLASAADPSAAGDLALIFNYMKVLDPTSVVRESEFAQAASTGAYGERIKAAVNRVINGERLSADIRNDFVSRSQKLYDDAESNQMELENRFKSISERSKVNPENVIIPYRIKKKAKETQAQPEYVEVRVTASGRRLGKKADGTIEEIKQ